MNPDRADRARQLIVFADSLEAGGLTERAQLFVQKSRDAARDVLDLEHELASARLLADTMRRRHENYVAYHLGHCFNPDGTAKTDDDGEPGPEPAWP